VICESQNELSGSLPGAEQLDNVSILTILWACSSRWAYSYDAHAGDAITTHNLDSCFTHRLLGHPTASSTSSRRSPLAVLEESALTPTLWNGP